MRMRSVVSIVLLALVISAASAAEYHTKYKGDHRRGEPTEDMALVYVFRPATVGAAIKTWAFVDDELLGVCRAKGYYFALVPPGKHIFWSKAENTSAVEVEVEAGKIYYFKMHIRMGFNKAQAKLIQIDEADTEKFFAKCSFTEPTAEGRERAKEIIANRMDRAEKKAEKRKEKEGK
jgi:hypothetical protein